MVTRQAACLRLMNQSLTLLLEELNGTVLQSHHQIDQAIPIEVFHKADVTIPTLRKPGATSSVTSTQWP